MLEPIARPNGPYLESQLFQFQSVPAAVPVDDWERDTMYEISVVVQSYLAVSQRCSQFEMRLSNQSFVD